MCNIWETSGGCPGSPSEPHAQCSASIYFSGTTCFNLRKEVEARVDGTQTGEWIDPHNGGTYNRTNPGDPGNYIYLSRLTGDGKYVDLISLEFIQDYSSCRLYACSESQSQSIGDDGTNFCNFHNLYCSDEGCNPFTPGMVYTENVNEGCTECSPEKCIV